MDVTGYGRWVPVYAAMLCARLWVAGPLSLDRWLAATFLMLCGLAITRIDAQQLRIPDALNLTVLLGGLTWAMPMGVERLAWAAASCAAAAAILLLFRAVYRRLRGREGLGLGDVKFCGAAAAWVGIEDLAMLLVIASLSGLIAAAIKHFGRLRGDLVVAFGPHLSFGLFATWLMLGW